MNTSLAGIFLATQLSFPWHSCTTDFLGIEPAATQAIAPNIDRRVQLPRGVKDRALVRLVLPSEIDPGNNGEYATLRIWDTAGHETPYVIDPQPPSPSTYSPPLSDVGFVNGRYTEVTADLGSGAPLRNGLDVVLPEDTFFTRAEVSSSDDRRTWRMLANQSIIYRVDGNQSNENLHVEFPPSRARRLRVRFLEPHHPLQISAINVSQGDSPPAALQPVRAAVRRSESSAEHTTVFLLDALDRHRAVSGVRFHTGVSAFHRSVHVEASETPTDFFDVDTQSIDRDRTGGDITTQFAERHARYWRVTVANADDAPISDLEPTLVGTAHALVFMPRTGAEYRVTSGGKPSARPIYDLAQSLQDLQWKTAGDATLPAATERKPNDDGICNQLVPSGDIALKIVLGILICTLASISFRMFRVKPEEVDAGDASTEQ